MEESESAESDEMPSPPKMSMKPLNINIPHHGERDGNHLRVSPPSSPAGTISVPNSCPTSPNRYSKKCLFPYLDSNSRPFFLQSRPLRTPPWSIRFWSTPKFGLISLTTCSRSSSLYSATSPSQQS